MLLAMRLGCCCAGRRLGGCLGLALARRVLPGLLLLRLLLFQSLLRLRLWLLLLLLLLWSGLPGLPGLLLLLLLLLLVWLSVC
jgi:hypothetical protein